MTGAAVLKRLNTALAVGLFAVMAVYQPMMSRSAFSRADEASTVHRGSDPQAHAPAVALEVRAELTEQSEAEDDHAGHDAMAAVVASGEAHLLERAWQPRKGVPRPVLKARSQPWGLSGAPARAPPVA